MALINPRFSPAHEKDDRIKFYEFKDEEEHIYEVDGWPRGMSMSVSEFLKRGFPPFEEDRILTELKERPYFARTLYYPILLRIREANKLKSEYEIDLIWREEIKALWESNRVRGKRMHRAIERYYTEKDRTEILKEMSDPKSGFLVVWHQFIQFALCMARRGYAPFRSEWQLYTGPEHMIVGTPDIFFVHPTNDPGRDPFVLKLALFDWKLCRAFRFSQEPNAVRSFRVPMDIIDAFSDLPDCNMVHYQLQLHIYKWIIENFYTNVVWRGHTYRSVLVVEMYLKRFHENIDQYKCHRCPVCPRGDRVPCSSAKEFIPIRWSDNHELVRRVRAAMEQRRKEVAQMMAESSPEVIALMMSSPIELPLPLDPSKIPSTPPPSCQDWQQVCHSTGTETKRQRVMCPPFHEPLQ